MQLSATGKGATVESFRFRSVRADRGRDDEVLKLLDQPTMRRREYDREGKPEVRFLWRHRPTLLPV